jgi:hypothetical protein
MRKNVTFAALERQSERKGGEEGIADVRDGERPRKRPALWAM